MSLLAASPGRRELLVNKEIRLVAGSSYPYLFVSSQFPMPPRIWKYNMNVPLPAGSEKPAGPASSQKRSRQAGCFGTRPCPLPVTHLARYRASAAPAICAPPLRAARLSAGRRTASCPPWSRTEQQAVPWMDVTEAPGASVPQLAGGGVASPGPPPNRRTRCPGPPPLVVLASFTFASSCVVVDHRLLALFG